MREMAERSIIRARSLLAASGAETADFGAGDRDFDVAVERNLLLKVFVKLAFEFAHFPAPNTRDVNMVAGTVTLVKVAMTSKMKKVELINQTQFLEHFQGAIDGDAGDCGINFLSAREDFVRVEVLRRSFDHLKQSATLARQTNAAGLRARAASGRAAP